MFDYDLWKCTDPSDDFQNEEDEEEITMPRFIGGPVLLTTGFYKFCNEKNQLVKVD